MRLPCGRIEVGSVAGNGTVKLEAIAAGWQLGYDAIAQFGDIDLVNASFDISGDGGDTIQVRGGRVTMADGSALLGFSLGSAAGGSLAVRGSESVTLAGANATGAPSLLSTLVQVGASGDGGAIAIETGRLTLEDGSLIATATGDRGNSGHLSIRVTEAIVLRGTDISGSGSSISSQAFPGALLDLTPQEVSELDFEARIAALEIGNAGNIAIETGRLQLEDGAAIVSETLSSGNAGNLTVRASGAIELRGNTPFSISSRLLSRSTGGATGNAGDLTLETQRLLLDDGAAILTGTFGSGQGGNVRVRAAETIELRGVDIDGFPSSISSQAFTSGFGDLVEAGDITLETRRLLLDDGARIESSAGGFANGGDLTVRASESVELRGTQNFSRGDLSSRLTSNLFGGVGNAGNLTIDTGRLTLADGAVVLAETQGMGNGGRLSVRASDGVELRGRDADGAGSSVRSRVLPRGTGNAGRLTIDAGGLLLRDEAEISASTLGMGNANDLNISAANGVIVTDGSLVSTETAGGGNAGNLTIESDRFTVSNGGRILASGAGAFPAGTLTIAADTIRLEMGGRLLAETESGDRGNIVLRSEDVRLRRTSGISASAFGSSTGGNIIIDTDTLVALENSDITANAEQAFGGRVTIAATAIFGTEFRAATTPQSDITATSSLGAAFSGIVEINTPDVDSTSGLVDLSVETVDIAAILNTDPCNTGETSEFVITGRGGLPPRPSDSMLGTAIAIEWGEVERSRPLSSVPISPVEIPREARSWFENAHGDVVLSADGAGDNLHIIPWQPASCSPLK